MGFIRDFDWRSLEAIHNINLNSLLDTLISLAAAFVLGALIGLERQYRQRTAGLRTNVLVAVGAAAFVDMANRLTGHEGAVHITAYVVSGVGFLGAGAIMKGDANIRGLNTAATLWGSAAVGACAGADLLLEAACATLFVLGGNTWLRPLVNRIDRAPIDGKTGEASYSVCVICNRQDQRRVRQHLEALLEAARYPAGDFEVRPFAGNDVQIFATLLPLSVDADELERVVEQLAAGEGVNQAFWSSSVTE
ncbi:MgtC/SapB family protein [Methylomagnum ishizawai]|uniref:MgtC/SapB family protein n=1 Tax=Methylomagnum ishizawai TaxID=1760988 RepID=UPI001C34275C|nr:MgtC/SapB family protein [Methylomagnum ishizawai]BBL76707.1 methyltransferase [Methylomagnum ishizawai]